jgi:hypothetical protein
MEFQLKSISLEGVEEALSKVETYRFLNQPEEAESICHDVLAIAPGHQLALRLLGLAITDQFTGGPSDRYADAEKIFRQLRMIRTSGFTTPDYCTSAVPRPSCKPGVRPHTLLVLLEECHALLRGSRKDSSGR